MNGRMLMLAALLVPLVASAGEAAESGRTYTPGPFDSVEISGSAAVRFAQGRSDEVVVEGDDEAQKSVALEVRDGVLYVRPSGGWKFWNARRLQLAITSRELRRVAISGAADFVAPAAVTAGKLEVQISGAGLARFDKLRCETLAFHVSGAGDGQMAGSAGTLAISVSGRGEFRGENLAAERASVQVSGIGDVKVWVTQALQVSVSGVGTVDYWGSPQVVRRSSGIARINERGPRPVGP